MFGSNLAPKKQTDDYDRQEVEWNDDIEKGIPGNS